MLSNLKKLMAILLAASVLPSMAALADGEVIEEEIVEEDVSSEEFVIPDNLKFWITGETYKNEAHFWHSDRTAEGNMTAEKLVNVLSAGMPEFNVQRVLENNYAFVNGSEKFWNISQKDVMTKPALMNEKGEFKIPSDIAKKLFGVRDVGEYTMASTIASNTDYGVFTDIRGFLLFSKNIAKAVKTNMATYSAVECYSDAFVISECIGTITWDDINPTKEDYENYKERWLEALTFPKGTQEEYKDYIKSFISQAGEFMKTVNRESDIEPFTDIPIPDFAAVQDNQNGVEMSYTRVYNMALGYRLAKMTGDTSLDLEALKKDILDILELLYDKYYTNNCYRINGTPRFTTFRFQTPPTFANTIMLMYDELGEEKRMKYVNEMWGKQLISPFLSLSDTDYSYFDGANLLWSANGFFHLAIIAEDTVRINHCLRYLNNIFEFMKKGAKYKLPNDGWYEDGSFPYHGGVAYNLGYGHSFAITLADMALLTRDTVFDIRNIYGFENTYALQTNAWIPFVHNNTRLKLVQGRESPDLTARYFLVAMMVLADGAPESKKLEITRELKPKVKDYYNVLFKKERLPIFKHTATPYILESLKDYREYIDTVEERSEDNYNKVYYNMERVMHKTDKFIFGLSMSSERIKKYEALATNPASLQQWYIGDGMVYVLADKYQYSGKWWQNADPYFMPGTTVDSTQRALIPTNDMPMPNNAWAGGVTNGKYGAAGMVLGNAAISGLEGIKSYFMFDNEIVFVGSGISKGNGKVYTVVDNYMLESEENISENVYIDGKLLETETNREYGFDNPKYISVENGHGYVFFGENNVSVNKKEITEGFPYLVTTVNHRTKNNDGYAYAVLPKTEKEKVAAYAENPDIEIISCNNAMHAVRDKESGLVMANIFSPSVLEGISFETPCSVMIENKAGKKTVYLSDPTFKREKLSAVIPDNASVIENEFCKAEGKRAVVDITATIGRTYSFDIVSDDYATAGLIKTYNYSLKTKGNVIVSQLYAGGGNVSDYKYTVIKNPIYGKVNIIGSKLIYIPNTVGTFNDTIEIEVSDAEGNAAVFNVNVKGVE